jgi:hypothetical protein
LPYGSRSRRLTGGEPTADIRPGLLAFMEDMFATLNFGKNDTAVRAARRVMDEMPQETAPMEVLMAFDGFIGEECREHGIILPSITGEELWAGGQQWHLFPNQVILQGTSGLLGYRARPNGYDPNS